MAKDSVSRPRSLLCQKGYDGCVGLGGRLPGIDQPTAGDPPSPTSLWRKDLLVLALERCAKKIGLPPDQTAHANAAEIVEGQCEAQWQDLEVLSANPCTDICDVANSTRVHASFIAQK